MPARLQRDLLLCKHLDLVPHHIQTPVVGGVELEHGLAVAGPEQLVGQRQDARRLPSPRRSGEDEVGHVAVAGDDLEAGDGIGVADDVRHACGAVLLHPRDVVGVGGGGGGGGGGHGAWVC
uniref:Pco108913 n=1 Tax=Arundo donax TaxID=35708 RepID=A0A0A9FGG6_ARUDO